MLQFLFCLISAEKWVKLRHTSERNVSMFIFSSVGFSVDLKRKIKKKTLHNVSTISFHETHINITFFFSFQASSFQLLKLEILLRWSFFTFSKNKDRYDPSVCSSPKPHGMDRPPRGFEECSNTWHPLLEYPSQHSELSLNINYGTE